MRLSSLPGTFLLATSLVCGATAQTVTPATPSETSRSSDKSFDWHPSPQSRQWPWNYWGKGMKGEIDGRGCYALRTYIMVRESRDSDVTHRDGYVTCQPAWKFEVRSAVETSRDR
jgi:hypothetical protein